MKKAILLAMALLLPAAGANAADRWTPEKAKTWWAGQKWPVGGNYIPSTAINQLEMWQEGTFDAPRIEQEFTWAQGMGMTTMRVFLHDMLWQQDAPGFNTDGTPYRAREVAIIKTLSAAPRGQAPLPPLAP